MKNNEAREQQEAQSYSQSRVTVLHTKGRGDSCDFWVLSLSLSIAE